MISFAGQGILLDIEGTTSSVTFVYDVMFPFVRAHLADHLEREWDEPRLHQVASQIASDAGHDDLATLLGEGPPHTQRANLAAEVMRQMDADKKVTGLKSLQGDIWQDGFHSGQLVAHVYDDVIPAIERWRAAGCAVRIYSSGSIAAQKLFFGHTQQGDLLPLFDAHYDTTTGSKRTAASYSAIAQDWDLPPGQILFVSDVIEELDAAREAGVQTILCCRQTMLSSEHDTCRTFDEISLA